MEQQTVITANLAGQQRDLLTLKTEYLAAGYKVRLFQSPFIPTPTSLQADFIAAEATFTGYALQTVTAFAGPMIDSSNNVLLAATGNIWVASDAVTPNTINGLWVEDTAGTVRKYVIFQYPIPMTTALAFLNGQIFESSIGTGYVVSSN